MRPNAKRFRLITPVALLLALTTAACGRSTSLPADDMTGRYQAGPAATEATTGEETTAEADSTSSGTSRGGGFIGSGD